MTTRIGPYDTLAIVCNDKPQKYAACMATFQTCLAIGPWSSLEVGDEGCIGSSNKLLRLFQTPKNMQHVHGNILFMFGPIWLFISFY